MKTYPEYKDSNLPWLGKIPKHWNILPNRSLFEERKIQNTENEELLSVTITKGVIKQTELLQNSSKKDTSNLDKSKYKLVMPGDIAYNKMRMWQGAVGMSKYRGIVSPAYIVLRVRQDVYPEYYHFLFRTPQYTGESYRYSYGICDDQLSLRYEDFKTINSPLPPLEEQKQIVKFLNYKCSKIAKFIRNKRRLIQLLQEQKQAIINQAVTRGINPNVRLKPSGVDYLGDIPEHWEVRRLKYLVSNVTNNTDTKDKNEIYIALEHIESWTGKLLQHIYNVVFDSQVKRFLSGDILFGKLRPYLAKVTRPNQNGVCVGELLVLRPKTDILIPEFIEQKLRSKHIIDLINSSTFGAKMPRAEWHFIGSIVFSFPPSKKEQEEIMSYILKETTNIDEIIARTNHEINLIREYRTRIISDVVTGKIDVRNIPVEPIEESQSDEGLDMVEEEQMQEELENFEEKTYENL